MADAWCDTTTPLGKLLLTILAGLAEFERSLIMARTQAGIAKARELGVAFGRPHRLNAKQKRIIARFIGCALKRFIKAGWRTQNARRIRGRIRQTLA